MNRYAVTISSVIVVAAESPSEASRLAHHYAVQQDKTGRDWECSAPELCNTWLPDGWSECDRVVGPHAMTVGEVLAEAA